MELRLIEVIEGSLVVIMTDELPNCKKVPGGYCRSNSRLRFAEVLAKPEASIPSARGKWCRGYVTLHNGQSQYHEGQQKQLAKRQVEGAQEQTEYQ